MVPRMLLLALACAPDLDTGSLTASAKADTASSPCASSPCRVLPLGDSITDGYNVPGGYRIDLEDLAATDGYGIDFVGSQSNGPADLADHDHEGHSGWRIDQIQAIVRARLATYTPDIVLLHIGTNDIGQGYLVSAAPNRLQRLVQTIVNDAPGALVVVASIIPINNPGLERSVVTFNRRIPGMVSRFSSGGDNVQYVNMHDALTTSDLADGVHPNEGGYDRMAATWYDAIAGSLR